MPAFCPWMLHTNPATNKLTITVCTQCKLSNNIIYVATDLNFLFYFCFGTKHYTMSVPCIIHYYLVYFCIPVCICLLLSSDINCSSHCIKLSHNHDTFLLNTLKDSFLLYCKSLFLFTAVIFDKTMCLVPSPVKAANTHF